jgi:hypothetical protein
VASDFSEAQKPLRRALACINFPLCPLDVREDCDNDPKVEAHGYDVKAPVTHCSTNVQSIVRILVDVGGESIAYVQGVF